MILGAEPRVETREFGRTKVSVVGDRVIVRTPFWEDDDEPFEWAEALAWARVSDQEVDFANPESYFYDKESDEEVYTFFA